MRFALGDTQIPQETAAPATDIVAEDAGLHPPKAPFGLAIGVTGHRYVIAGHSALDHAGMRLAHVFEQMEAAAERVRARHTRYFEPQPSIYRLISPLAEGTDQIAAEIGVRRKWRLETILPFAREEYLRDFCESADRDRFNALFHASHKVLELPGERAGAVDAYTAVGRAVVAQSDIIVTLWNGKAAGGRGGTAEIIEHALRNGLPVVHIPLEPDEPIRIMWAGYNDPPLELIDYADAPQRMLSDTALDELLGALLAPPMDGDERLYVDQFYNERERRRRYRFEYPLMLALLGAKPFRRSALEVDHYRASTRREWAAFEKGCSKFNGRLVHSFSRLEEAYSWADGLANHFAMCYRSGHVLNFALAATAVMLALTGLIAKDYKFFLVIAELAVVLGFIVNTRVGQKCQWHRRWLDYRQVAEQLRLMRSLKLCAITRGNGSIRRVSPGGWADWYAAAIWRAIGCPEGRLNADAIACLADVVATGEIGPQVSYHRSNAHRMEHVEHRLHRLADVLFKATVASLVAFLVVYVVAHEQAVQAAAVLVFVSAGFPAIAGALHAIREQGEFRRSARRSAANATALEALMHELETQPVSLARIASLVEEAARVMLEDIGEWRRAYEMRNLAIPA